LTLRIYRRGLLIDTWDLQEGLLIDARKLQEGLGIYSWRGIDTYMLIGRRELREHFVYAH
jgi:hypothetical protein